MRNLIENGQVQEMNPYVIQATRLSESLSYLSKVFNEKPDNSKNYDDRDVADILRIISQKGLREENFPDQEMRVLVEKILDDIECFGEELSIKNGRALAKDCKNFDEIKTIVEAEFTKVKKRRLKEGRNYEEREACLCALNTYAGASRDVTKELEKSIFDDKRIQKKITASLKKMGLKMLKCTILVSAAGGYEVMLTLKSKKDACVRTKDVAEVISEVIGKRVEAASDERMVVSKEYSTLQFVQCARYNIIHGVSQVPKEGSVRSGDNFLVMDIKNGKKAIIISDGMGSGESAYKMSSKILDAIESLLASGMSLKNAITICNSMLVSSQKGMDFGTLDVCLLDSYSGQVEIAKAGGTYTYLIGKKNIKCVEPSSLPVGIMNGIELDNVKEQLGEDTFIVMMTDGVAELIKAEDKGKFIAEAIRKEVSNNPNELAEVILNKILSINDGVASDDMMVVVVGCWQIKGY